MSNNLLNNTASLQNILEALQNKASGGATLETVVIQIDRMPDPGSVIYYLDESFSLHSEEITPNASYNILKNSIFICRGLGQTPNGAQQIFEASTAASCPFLAIGS